MSIEFESIYSCIIGLILLKKSFSFIFLKLLKSFWSSLCLILKFLTLSLKITISLSSSSFDKEIGELRKAINSLRKEKDEMINNLNKFKKKELNVLYSKINPIIQSYMEKNNINIVLDMKNILIGKSNSNITDDIMNEVNSKYN